jgi:Flp pilus assembly protein TadG
MPRMAANRSPAQSGAAFVELVIAMPVLVVVLMGSADFARVLYYTIELTNAARAGAQYASFNSVQATEAANITTAARNAAPNISLSASDVSLASPPNKCYCANNDGTGQPWSEVACNSTCSVSQHMVESVTVRVTKTFSTISRFPGIPSSLTLSRTATMRVAL